jgi:hypothetical protein
MEVDLAGERDQRRAVSELLRLDVEVHSSPVSPLAA